ncbi:VOC family protein [Macrococcus lamae]|uniref:Ring-cleaving dioxygenase n=1 Tax=Macrococcus lamae TaxID=198484 RepID=A0A4R6BX48_9STAP|nr:VOC family protein [Macrococcus lamae]TDM12813.1 ring-cleaving dioxygenase [Macrococcus lamae]
MKINGHHHISMYTKDVQANKDFYTQVLGLRLVEKSVNQDNPSMYHFFYGDEEGSPGTLLSFFEIPQSGQTRKGTNSIYRLSLLVPSIEAIDYFEQRLTDYHIISKRINYAGQSALSFEDIDQLEIVLIDNNQQNYPSFWKKNSYSDVPETYQILGMGPVELRLSKPESTIQFLTDVLGYHHKDEHTVTLDNTGLYSDFIIKHQDGDSVRPGRGYIHHIAVDIPDDAALEDIQAILSLQPGNNSGIIDRYFFKALYYRQNTILYEFATSRPGFMVDTTKEHLGMELNLPNFLEEKRAEIEHNLPPLK